MEDFQDIIKRLGQQLHDIDADINKPLVDVANKYRLTAETICKAILVGYGVPPQGNLEKLSTDAQKQIDAKENARDAGMFKAELRYLQNVGNTYSHDGAASDFTNKQGQSDVFDSLVKVIKITFFSNGELDSPTLPKSMEARFPARMLGLAKFENPRAEDVVQLCFPKQRVKTRIQKTDHTTRIVYDYVVADLGDGLSKGMMFIRSRTAIEKTLIDFLDNIGSDFSNSLEIITPRAYRTDGREIDRKKSIIDIIKSLSFESKAKNVHVKYFDDFVWESCLPESFRSDNKANKKPTYFIPQILEPITDIGNSTSGGSLSDSDYIENILNKPHDYAPVQIVIGPAGIGKTTFCDEISSYINARERKRVILLSATDFREISNSVSIDSVSALYRVAAINGLLDDESSIESHNFEINLACGNFVLLIDGFDELESHLGESLNFESFMRSLSDLEDCFRRVLVILTVRDYDIERFKHIRQTSICRLRGFSSKDTDSYFSKRLTIQGKIVEAKALIRSFNESADSEISTTVPLYASLICDYLLEKDLLSKTQVTSAPKSAKYFGSDEPLDTLVSKIIDREIAKQSLGNIRPDDFFDILIEIIRAPQFAITTGVLFDFVTSCGGETKNLNASNFLRNPFLRWEKDTISFKYDSLTYFFKSRLLARKISEGQFSEYPSIEFMAEFYRGEGPLFDEFNTIFPATQYADHPNTLKWFQSLSRCGNRAYESKLPWRKAMSAFMYWALSKNRDKAERTQNLSKYFGGTSWESFSIYGCFYPLDLKGINIRCGNIDNYTNLQSCDYIPGETVFYSTKIDFDDKSLPEKIDRSLFAADCIFSQNLTMSFHAKEIADQYGIEIIRDNIYKILKVGFRANRFAWKSKDVYKNVTVVGKFALDSYLDLLAKHGVLTSEHSRSGSEIGYVVSDAWHLDARKLVEEKNLTARMTNLISDLFK
ncbi:NACHT domain-containing protein [Undibacterium curvum]|uniref:NACHT domain-containing protein n=1 Tax=Undibacterium curvum TaxID=2762294 RepID=UPI003D0DABD3